MSVEYRAGIIGRTGQGDYGHSLDLAFEGIEGVTCVAVADSDPEGLRAAGDRLSISSLYGDYHDMLDKEELDLVSVGPRWVDCHAEMVIACAEAGVKGIFCEKPMARTLAEADAMVDVVEKHGVKFNYGTNRRFTRMFWRIRELISNGDLGKIQAVIAYCGVGIAQWWHTHISA